MDAKQATALRKPFPPESVGKLPKPYKKDSPRGDCRECGGYHGLPALHLDYVGHAATTDRLLTVDPEWSWEPMALDQYGSPQCDRDGNLWIRLTVCGVTRLGVGDGASMKERVGDAIRNAAMRFGVALDLWAKEDLVEFRQAAVAAASRTPEPEPQPTPQPDPGALNGGGNGFRGINDKSMREMFALFKQKGIPDKDQQLAGINAITGKQYESRAELSEADGRKVIAELRKRPDAPTGDVDE